MSAKKTITVTVKRTELLKKLEKRLEMAEKHNQTYKDAYQLYKEQLHHWALYDLYRKREPKSVKLFFQYDSDISKGIGNKVQVILDFEGDYVANSAPLAPSQEGYLDQWALNELKRSIAKLKMSEQENITSRSIDEDIWNLVAQI